jgi:NTE family protein
LVGVCFAAGKEISDIEDFFVNERAILLLKPSFYLGLLDGHEIVRRVLNFAGVSSFEDLDIPLTIVATNVSSGKHRSFSSGKLSSALNASIAVPGLFKPIKIDKEWYVDGGVYTPLPFGLAKEYSSVIAVDVFSQLMPISGSFDATNIVQNSIQILQKRIVELELNDSITLIRPSLEMFKFIEVSSSKRREMVKRGRIAARSALKNHK